MGWEKPGARKVLILVSSLEEHSRDGGHSLFAASHNLDLASCLGSPLIQAELIDHQACKKRLKLTKCSRAHTSVSDFKAACQVQVGQGRQALQRGQAGVGDGGHPGAAPQLEGPQQGHLGSQQGQTRLPNTHTASKAQACEAGELAQSCNASILYLQNARAPLTCSPKLLIERRRLHRSAPWCILEAC